MNSRDVVGSGLSLAGGVVLGATVMYLMDPQLGVRRRRSLSRAASDTLRGTRQSLGSQWQNAAEKVRDWGGGFGQQISRQAGKLSRGGLAERLGQRLRQRASEVASVSAQTIGLRPPRGRRSVVGITLTAVGALALGAGLMYLFDPERGRSRRASLREKVTTAANRASHSLQGTGRDLGHRARGMVEQVRSRWMPERGGSPEGSEAEQPPPT